jgi:hypothetical protein
MCYIPTSTTRCALTQARRDDHANTRYDADPNMQVDPGEKAPQIEVRMVRRSKVLVS